MTTIREHNRGRYDGFRRKADYIVGITLDGEFLCADCVGDQDVDAPNLGYGPNPVLSVQMEGEETCGRCLQVVT